MFRNHDLEQLTLAALAALALAGAPTAARAGGLAGYLSSSNAYRLGCRVRNVGTTPVTVVSAQVLLEIGTPFTDYQDCTRKPLQPGANCTFTGPGNTMAGVLKVVGGTRHLLGVCLLLAPGNDGVASVEMHWPDRAVTSSRRAPGSRRRHAARVKA